MRTLPVLDYQNQWSSMGLRHPLMMLGEAGYFGAAPQNNNDLVSLGRLSLGVGATAMGALEMTKAGIQPPLVYTDRYSPIR